MRTWWLVLLVVACNKRHEVPAGGPGSAAAPPADAQVADMTSDMAAAPDASTPDASAAGPAPVDRDKLLQLESIGPLRWGMSDAEAIKALGNPQRKTFPIEEGATGSYVSTWTWPHVTLEMASDTRQGAATVRLITVTAPTGPTARGSTYATARGIKLGSTLAEVAAAYPRSDDGSDDPTQYLVGDPYGGLLFILEDDKVAEMLLGPLAF